MSSRENAAKITVYNCIIREPKIQGAVTVIKSKWISFRLFSLIGNCPMHQPGKHFGSETASFTQFSVDGKNSIVPSLANCFFVGKIGSFEGSNRSNLKQMGDPRARSDAGGQGHITCAKYRQRIKNWNSKMLAIMLRFGVKIVRNCGQAIRRIRPIQPCHPTKIHCKIIDTKPHWSCLCDVWTVANYHGPATPTPPMPRKQQADVIIRFCGMHHRQTISRSAAATGTVTNKFFRIRISRHPSFPLLREHLGASNPKKTICAWTLASKAAIEIFKWPRLEENDGREKQMKAKFRHVVAKDDGLALEVVPNDSTHQKDRKTSGQGT